MDAERDLAEAMRPSRTLVRPLLVVVPESWADGAWNSGTGDDGEEGAL